jgi:carboxymethylenebutenolidase
MMKEREVAIELPNGNVMRAHWVLPDQPNGFDAAIIAIHDIFGYSDDIRRIARRLAENGYAVLAPNLYDRPGMKPLCVVKTLKAHETGKGYSFEQLEACRTWLLKQDEQPASKVGLMGFCMGGRFALLYAARAPVQVVAPFYGGVPAKAEDLQGICPAVGGWGRKDLIYGGHGDRLERHLTTLGVEHDIKTYPEAGHSYMNDHQNYVFRNLAWYSPLRARHDPEAAEDSWQRVLAFFGKTLS